MSRGLAVTVAVVAAVVAAGVSASSASASDSGPLIRVIVRGQSGAAGAVRAAVEQSGGRVRFELPIIDGVAASVPADLVPAVEAAPGVTGVTPDASGRMLATCYIFGFPYTCPTTTTTTTTTRPTTTTTTTTTTRPTTTTSTTGSGAPGYDPATDTGSLDLITRITGARSLWSRGSTGQGVDVALIDTGVAPVAGMTVNLLHGPDLSFESQADDTRHVDRFGHGTHLAGIIAGRDGDGTAATAGAAGAFTGMAPGSRVISLKVGAGDGMADVSQVIAAINWVTQYGRSNGLNVRVLNLSYGSDATQDYRADPLAYAVEAAWRKGIVVVVAGGNQGLSREFLTSPALNPNVIAVGATDPMGTLATGDDTIPAFSSRGASHRYVDLVAPGSHVLGLRAPGGYVDTTYPGSRVGTRFTRGSGTSQASAVVAGAAALLLSNSPGLTPDQVKWLLTKGAAPMAGAGQRASGAGQLDLARSLSLLPTVPANATLVSGAQYGLGNGSLEGSRGQVHISINGNALMGEKDIFGKAWNASTWAAKTLSATTWNQGTWNGAAWTGLTWASSSQWAGRTWVDNAWTGRTWVSEAWAGRTWVGTSWSGRTWVNEIWANGSWS